MIFSSLILFMISKEDDSCETVARCHFRKQQNGFPRVLFHRPFIGGASVAVHQCYQQNLFDGDPSLISTYLMLRSA